MKRKCSSVCPGGDFMEESAENNEEAREPGRDDFVKELNAMKGDRDVISELKVLRFHLMFFFTR